MKHFKMNDNLTYVPNPHVFKNVFLIKLPSPGALPKYDRIKDRLPEPVWDGHEDALGAYDYAWKIAFGNLRKAKKSAGFVSDFIDTAFNGYLFMWDSSFIVMFGKYASRIFDFQRTLDNFYSHQHIDGFICREICETEPGAQFSRDDPSSTGPNILPWAEWEYYQSTGDLTRLKQVFDPLLAYHNWLRLYRSWPDGTYWSTGWGCGMDNQRRMQPGYDVSYHHGFMSWIDTCSQQYLSGTVLLEIAKILGREDEVEWLKEEHELLSRFVNSEMWDEERKYYFDRYRDGSLSEFKTVGAYWALLAGLVPEDRRDAFVAHLDNEAEFKRPNRVPTVSADTPGYDPEGSYWMGSVWAPTNYMVLSGLRKYGYDKLAHEIGLDCVTNVARVFQESGTLYENYAPERAARGNQSKPAFVGWSGLFPISILFEYVFGLTPNARESVIDWDIRLTERHGVRRYPLGDATLELICEARSSEEEEPVVTVRSDKPVTVRLHWKGGERTLSVSSEQ